jgi:glycosyltransferase involved in cell wall biosynthesis
MYLYHLIKHLAATADNNEIVLFPFFNLPPVLRHPESSLGWTATIARALLSTRLAGSWNPVFRASVDGAQLFHASNLVRAMPSGAVLTTTVHDLTALCTPELHRPQTVHADKAFFSRIVSRASQIIAISNNTKNDLIKYLKIDDARITVIYPGVRDEYFVGDPANGSTIRMTYGLTQPYILFVGTIEPRKNLSRLLDAYSALKADVRTNYSLVVIGMQGWRDEGTLRRLKGGTPGVTWLGYVAEEDMPAIMAGASLFVFPSLYEGFGFPVAEAMAAGVPVLTSTSGSLPEVVGDAACCVDPMSVAEIQSAMERLLTSPEERRGMSLRGRKQAQKYSWQDSARRTWGFFEKAVG